MRTRAASLLAMALVKDRQSDSRILRRVRKCRRTRFQELSDLMTDIDQADIEEPLCNNAP